MTSNIGRMAVNAAIEKLIGRMDDDGQAAQVVVAYGSQLKKSNSLQMEYTRTNKSSGDKVSGYSPGLGEVTIHDAKREEHREWSSGVHKDRVGYYRLWKEKDGLLVLHHFWKSSIATQVTDDDPEVYHLGYNPVSLEPLYFGVQRERIVCRVWLGCTLEISRLCLEQIYGHVPPLRITKVKLY